MFLKICTGIREWFRWYKVPSGKPLNAFEYNEMCLSRAFAAEVIQETHEEWENLVSGKAKIDTVMWTR